MKSLIKIKNIEDLGPQFANNNHKMVGQDGAYSIPLNEKTFWFFGDTLIGARTEDESLWYPDGQRIGAGSMSGTGNIEEMLTNTGLLLSGKVLEGKLKNFEYILNDNGSLKQIIPLLESEDHDQYRIWCLHGIKIKEKLYLFYQKVEMLDIDGILPVNFDLVGTGLAVGNDKNWQFKRLYNENDYIIWNNIQPQFATSVLNNIEVDGYIYLYGVIKNKENIQECYIARALPDRFEDFSSYEYFTSKNNWDANINNAIPIFSGMPNELSVSYNNYFSCYLAVHSYDLTGKIVARTSPTPYGPWSDIVELYQVEAERKLDLPYPILIYAGKEHPELSEKDGKIIYITYIEFEEYLPHLIKVEFE